MLKIWGRKTSSNVQKVLWACDELGLTFERTDLGGPFGGNDTADYLAKNPNGRIPTIDDDGFILWESNVCVRYLAAKHDDGGLYPTDLKFRAEADQWMDWQQTMLCGPLLPFFVSLVFTAPEDRNEAATAANREATAKQFAILDAHFAGRKFVAGADFTMGDIPVGVWTRRWFAVDQDRPSLPHLEAWYERLTERSGFAARVMIPYK